MNDPQNLGLGELGQRIQAMSDPATDSRLRPYHGAAPAAPTSNGHSGPALESYEDLRTAPTQQADVHQFQPAYSHQPFQSVAPGRAAGSVLAAGAVSAPNHDPLSSRETLSLPAYAESRAPTASQARLLAGSRPVPSAANALDAPKSGLHRALDAIRSTLPLVQKLLPLIDSNFAASVGALVAPHSRPAPPPAPQVVHVDMGPMERGLAEVRNSHRELRGQVQEQVTTLKRVEDQLERVREATDRNTLEQQELVEDLRTASSRTTAFAVAGLVLLVISLGLNIYLLVEMQHILR
jgi:hypothetical protein